VLAATVEASMSESLVAGENDAVTSMFSSLERCSPDVDVLVFDPDGVVAFALRSEHSGRRVASLTASGAVVDAVSHALANKPRRRAPTRRPSTESRG